MKKLLTGIVASSIVATFAVPVFAQNFPDIKGTAYEWAQPYIETMAEQGLISGYEDGTYRPQNAVSRLETIVLFAHAMGSGSDINATAVEYAMQQYADVIDSFELNFGQKEVAFMLYRGVLSEAEATSYLKGDSKNQPMPRYEAATIITKAMGGEAEAKKNLVLDMEYTDVSDIPSAAKKYVHYVTQKKIMNGMGDGTFSPKTSVLRAQIAVMLSNTVETMGLSIEQLKISSIDTVGLNMTVKEDDGTEYNLAYTADTTFFVEGEKAQPKDITDGVNAIVTMNNEQVLYVDVNCAVPDSEIYGIFRNFKSENGVLSLSVSPADSKETNTYECISSIRDITKNDQPATIRDFKDGDYVVLTLSSGKITAISGIDKTIIIKNATIEAINHSADKPTITISHAEAEYNGQVYEVSSNAVVMKGGEMLDMNSVYRGDKVTITLEYGIIAKVVAESSKKTVEGTIRSINISNTPTITVLVNGEEKTYDVSNDITITVNGEKGSLYDFRVGDSVTLTTESDAVVKIATNASQTTSASVTGTVTMVNSAYGFIKVNILNADGSTYEETVYCKDSKTTFITAAGVTKNFRDVKEGSTVAAYGARTNGAFEATSVIIVG